MNMKTYAIICGSTGYQAIKAVDNATAISPIDTPYGLSRPLLLQQIENVNVYWLSRHGENGYHISAPFVNYRANIWALKKLGVTRIIGWSGPGAIDPSIPIGDILVPNDIIDETKSREYTFFNGTGLGFIRQNPVFCPSLSESLRNNIKLDQNHCRDKDVYVCTEGPRLETAAEIKKYSMFGATLVGMTLVPEVFLAKELEMCYCPICYVTNYAEGIKNREFKPGELFEGLNTSDDHAKVAASALKIPKLALDSLLNSNDVCKCQQSMERYRLRGDIKDDWEKWIDDAKKLY